MNSFGFLDAFGRQLKFLLASDCRRTPTRFLSGFRLPSGFWLPSGFCLDSWCERWPSVFWEGQGPRHKKS